MLLSQVTLSEYLSTRRKMRLLLNLVDLGIAYNVFSPIYNIHRFWPLLARLRGGPLVLAGASTAYLVFALLAAIMGVALAAKIKSLLLSDSRSTLTVIGILSMILGVAYFISLPNGVGLIVAAIPGVYVYAVITYIRRLNALEKHPVYNYLVGLQRRSFTFATARYNFFSRESLQVYATILLASWKACLLYISLGALMLCVAVLNTKESDSWFWGLHPGIQVLVGFCGVLLFSQIWAYGRMFVANEATRFVRELRSRLARSASALARKDNRPPILLLRSFKDDGILVENERYWGHRFLGIRDKQIRLEEVIAETLYPYGPLIALSNPADSMPLLGAAKENITDLAWERAVERYIEQASKIVLILGVSQNFRWEVSQILSRGLLQKCFFVFPPAYRGLNERSRLLTNCLPELGYELGLRSEEEEAAMLSDALVSGGVRPGEGVIIKAHNGNNALAYAEALRLLHNTGFLG
jgi:hypothetical protein